MNEKPTALQAALATLPTTAPEKPYGWAWGLMHGYDATYANQSLKVISVEDEFLVPVHNFDGKKLSQSRTWQLAGKMDVQVTDDRSQPWVVDHKTSSEDIGPESDYWQQLVVEGQANLYSLVSHLQGVAVAGAIWDAIRKPGIKPKTIPEKDRAGIASAPHTYYARTVSDVGIRYAIDGGKGVRETAELFGYRVAAECLEKPERYFARRQVPKLQQDLLEFATELWDVSQEMRQARSTGKHFRNSGACRMYNRACAYLGLCSGYNNPESNNWQRRACVHSELTTLEGDGRDVLTHSRVRCFQTCRRKHYYRYELGIERAGEEEIEALYFGSMIHTALEAWWNFHKEAQHGHSS